MIIVRKKIYWNKQEYNNIEYNIGSENIKLCNNKFRFLLCKYNITV